MADVSLCYTYIPFVLLAAPPTKMRGKSLQKWAQRPGVERGSQGPKQRRWERLDWG